MDHEQPHLRLGAQLLATRLAAGLSQTDVAQRVGCSIPTVQLAEGGGGILMGYAAMASQLGMVLDGDALPGGDNVGQSLALLRQRRGITGQELSRMASVSTSALTALEAGYDCPLPSAARVARKLGVVLRLREGAGPRRFYSWVARASAHEAWTTPPSLLEKLYPLVGGTFTLDPCSPTKDGAEAPVRAGTYYTKQDDGLALAWDGDVFMNPPYGRAILNWVTKARGEVEDGNASSVLGLVPARTDTGWWHDMVAPSAHAWLLRGRLRFGGKGGGAAPFASALVLWGGDDVLRARLHAAFPPGRAAHVRPDRTASPCLPPTSPCLALA